MGVRILKRGKADDESMKDWKYFNKTHQAKTGKSETKHYYDVSETGRREIKEDAEYETMVFI